MTLFNHHNVTINCPIPPGTRKDLGLAFKRNSNCIGHFEFERVEFYLYKKPHFHRNGVASGTAFVDIENNMVNLIIQNLINYKIIRWYYFQKPRILFHYMYINGLAIFALFARNQAST